MNKLVDKVPDGYALVSIDALKAWGKYDEVRNACQFQAEQAEQEPVAWRWPTHNGYAYAETHFDDEGGEPLYAAPVRTKDLTGDELSDLMFDYEPCENPFKFARAVIAKDREKNR